MAITMTKFNLWVQNSWGTSTATNFASDTLKIALTNSAPSASQSPATYSGLASEIANGNGYTTGGISLATLTWSNSSGTSTLATTATPTWTASGGSMATFRYFYIYDVTTGYLVAFGDNGSGVTLTTGQSYQLTFTGGNVLTLA